MADDLAKVVSLKGTPIVPRGAPREDVAEELEELARMARAGELDGFAAALLFQDDCTSYRYKGRITRATIGAMEMLKFQMLYDDAKEEYL